MKDTMVDSVDYSHDSEQWDDITDDLKSIEPLTLPIDKEFHIFISYKSVSPDQDIAYRIDKLLRQQGFKCCLHERDFLPGEAIVNNIVQNIERSVKVVFILSENSKNSEWCQFELNVTETIHIQNKGYKPIIIKLDDCEVPDTMKRYTYLSGTTHPEEWINKVAKAINNQTDHLITSRKNIKFVAVPCIDYNRDKFHIISKCRYPHVCAKYIICDESCDGRCGKNHNLVTDQSREILIDLGFITDSHDGSLLKTYSQKCKEKLADMPQNIVTGPCCYYNYKGCLLGEFHCPFTHICKKWFLGKCFDVKCGLSHDILNKHTKRLLKIFKVNLNQPTDAILDDYREVYPHKKFLSLPTKMSKATIIKENWFFIVLGGATIAIATALIVNRLQKSTDS